MSAGSVSGVRRAAAEPAWLRLALTAVGLGFLFFFLGVPLVAVFSEAFASGWSAYAEALRHPETLSAIGLTVFIAVVVLPFNVAFGVAASWAIAKFDFRGKSLLITLIDLPFAVSPVVAHSIPSGPKATRQPWWRLPEPAGIPVRIGVASVSERRSSARRPFSSWSRRSIITGKAAKSGPSGRRSACT